MLLCIQIRIYSRLEELQIRLHSQKKGYRNSTPGLLLLQTAPFFQRGAKTVLLGAPNYGQPNSTPRGAVSAPFFSECETLTIYILQQ